MTRENTGTLFGPNSRLFNLWVPLAIGLALRVAVVCYLGVHQPPDRESGGADVVELEHMAWTFSEGQGLRDLANNHSAFRAPGYPLILGSLYWLFGHHYFLNPILQIAVSLATCAATYWLALRMKLSRREAFLASLMIACLPLHFYYAAQFLSELLATLFTALTALALVVGFEKRTGQTGRAFAGMLFVAGVLNGFNILVRPIALLVIPTLGLMMLLSRTLKLRQVLIGSLAFGVGSLVVMAPYTYRNYVRFDRLALVSSNGGSTFWGANNEIVADPSSGNWGYWISTNFAGDLKKEKVLTLENEIDRDKMEYRLGLEFLIENPDKLPSLFLGKALGLVRLIPKSQNKAFRVIVGASQILFFPLVLGGMFLALRQREERQRFFVPFVFVVVLVELTLIFYMSLRFRVPTEPLLAIFAAFFVGRVWERIAPKSSS